MDIEQDHVGLIGANRHKGIFNTPGLSDHLDRSAQLGPDPRSKQPMVVDDQDTEAGVHESFMTGR